MRIATLRVVNQIEPGDSVTLKRTSAHGWTATVHLAREGLYLGSSAGSLIRALLDVAEKVRLMREGMS